MGRIYTKTGDLGETSLFGGRRVLKSDPQVEACGSLDELNSFLGLVRVKLKKEGARRSRAPGVDSLFLIIQKDLYKIMSFLAAFSEAKTKHGAASQVLAKRLRRRVKEFEERIDELEKTLPKITRFVLVGGEELSCWFHILRAMTRRGERALVRFFNDNESRKQRSKQVILMYLNRLSDLFFMLARVYNKEEETIFA